MLDPGLDTLGLLESANKGRVPELAGDTQIFAAPHQRVTLARLGGSRESARIKVLLLATSDRHESSADDETPLARQDPLLDRFGSAGHESPLSRSQGRVEDAAVQDLWEVEQTIRFDLDLFSHERSHEHLRLLPRDDRRAQPVPRRRPVDPSRRGAIISRIRLSELIGVARREGRLPKLGERGTVDSKSCCCSTRRRGRR